MIGTSLEVAPVRFVPEEAHLIPGLKKAMINLDETPYDHLFVIVIHQKLPSLFGSLTVKKALQTGAPFSELHHNFFIIKTDASKPPSADSAYAGMRPASAKPSEA